jgi:hypothetical protein
VRPVAPEVQDCDPSGLGFVLFAYQQVRELVCRAFVEFLSNQSSLGNHILDIP